MQSTFDLRFDVNFEKKRTSTIDEGQKEKGKKGRKERDGETKDAKKTKGEKEKS